MIILSSRLKNYIKEKGDVFFVDDSPFLSKLSFHTDLRLFGTRNTIISAPSLFNDIKGIIPEEIRLIKGKTEPVDGYPKDCIYNAVSIGRFIFYNPKTVSSQIIEISDEEGYIPIKVRQGYCRCNICVVNDERGKEALITEDDGIYLSALKNGINALLLNKGEITLPGHEYGFIGGNSVTTDRSIIFFGKIKDHSQCDLLESFIKDNSDKEILSLDCPVLIDAGGGLFINR